MKEERRGGRAREEGKGRKELGRGRGVGGRKRREGRKGEGSTRRYLRGLTPLEA